MIAVLLCWRLGDMLRYRVICQRSRWRSRRKQVMDLVYTAQCSCLMVPTSPFRCLSVAISWIFSKLAFCGFC